MPVGKMMGISLLKTHISCFTCFNSIRTVYHPRLLAHLHHLTLPDPFFRTLWLREICQTCSVSRPVPRNSVNCQLLLMTHHHVSLKVPNCPFLDSTKSPSTVFKHNLFFTFDLITRNLPARSDTWHKAGLICCCNTHLPQPTTTSARASYTTARLDLFETGCHDILQR